MISILINIPVLAVVSRDTSRQIMLTMRTKRKQNSKEKEGERPRKST